MKYVDLSHAIFKGMSTYPSDPDVIITKEKDINKHNSLLHSFKMGTHTGTHLDAPAHIIPNSKMVSDFHIECFSGVAIKIDNKTYSDLGNISNDIDGIIYETGWFKFFNNPEKFYGSNRPVIPESVIEFSLDNSIKFFGCDLPSVDKSGSKIKKIHNSLLGSDIIIYESLANLDQLPSVEKFQFFGFPLPFINLEASPVRAVGIL